MWTSTGFELHEIRYEPKTFRVRRQDGSWGIGDVPRVLYRLPELLAAGRAGETVYLVEGEKDADRLASLGLAVTCNFDGAGKWNEDYNRHFNGTHVVVVADRDEPGYRHALAALRNLRIYGDVASLRVVEPATAGEHDDVSDHLDAGHTIDQLVPIEPDQLARRAGESPPPPSDADGLDDEVAFEEEVRSTEWERTDLGPILDDTYRPPEPGVLHRSDGPGLLYPGLVHQVIGQPESGKSWLVLLAVAARLAAGERVLFLDHESDPVQVVGRLLALGVDRAVLAELFDYRRPEVSVIGTKDTTDQVKQHGVPLPGGRMWAAARVVIDGTDPEHLDVRIAPPLAVLEPGDAATVGERGAAYERNAELMERLSRTLETAGEEITSTEAVKRTKGRRERLFPALQALAREGFTSQRTVGMAQMQRP